MVVSCHGLPVTLIQRSVVDNKIGAAEYPSASDLGTWDLTGCGLAGEGDDVNFQKLCSLLRIEHVVIIDVGLIVCQHDYSPHHPLKYRFNSSPIHLPTGTLTPLPICLYAAVLDTGN